MRRMTYFVMALALVLGFTQCKKEQVNTPGNETKTVNITLNVGGNGGGSRHDINTVTGAVTFQNGDVIYVGDGSTYIGTLTRENNVFSGPINEPADGSEIYFYFVGGLTPSSTPETGTTPSFTVDISDQSSKMPVLSCNHVTFHTGVASYSCVLQNQCALVKFTTASTTAPVHVGGLYTGAMIDFDNNSITNNGTTGFVALNSKSATEKWAVLLPQTGFNAEAAIAHVGYTATIPTIEADGFITGDAAISISTPNNIVYLDWLTSDYTATDGQTLKGTLAHECKISIADGATVTLDGVSINANGAWTSGNYAGITCSGDATIILKDGTENTVKGFYDEYPGIFAAVGHTLTIKGGAAGTGKLTASSNGWGAGIGGGYQEHCGNIEIQGGDINATGGRYAAGIGGGDSANCGTITISGGTVTATGGEWAAGIGGSSGSSDSANCRTITISGGTVTATGGDLAPGIGSGFSASCDAITISGGTVTATGGEGAAGIGGGESANCGDITITTGVTSVTATKGEDAVISIGVGDEGTCGTINIGGTEYPNGADANQADGLTFIYPMVTTITWDQTTVGSIWINVNEYDEYTNGIITIKPSTDNAIWSGNSIQLYDTEDKLTFSTSTGNITEIEITFEEMEYDVGIPSSNWTCTDHKLIWTGFSSSVELGCMASKGGPDPGDEPGDGPGGGGGDIIEPIFQLTYVTKVEFTVRQ